MWLWASLKLEIDRVYHPRMKDVRSAENPNGIKLEEY
jgi:hypothetical protein